MVLVNIVERDFINRDEKEFVIKTINLTLKRIKDQRTGLIDVYLFESSHSMNAFLIEESRALGVLTHPIDSFIASHDAWRGTPRIIICMERLRPLSERVKRGVIEHEIGHALLHGSLVYYLLSIPDDYLAIEEKFEVISDFAANSFYLISIAVKDYEVTRFLLRKGFFEDQKAYIEFLLSEKPEKILSLKDLRVLQILSTLKDLAYAKPLSNDPDIRLLISSLLNRFPNSIKRKLNIVLEALDKLSEDTESNIYEIANICLREIIIPVLSDP